MKTTIILIGAAYLSGAMLIAGQTNFGPAVAGVQLSVGITNNNIISRHGTNWMQCVIKNSSTNTIFIGDVFSDDLDFKYSVIDPSGTNFNLLPRSEGRAGSYAALKIGPGKIHAHVVKVRADKELKPGSYKLQIEGRFSSEIEHLREITSNLLEVEIQ